MSNQRTRNEATSRSDGYIRRVRSLIKQARAGRPGLVVSMRWVADVTEDGSIVWTPTRAKAAKYHTADAAHGVARYVESSRQGDELRGAVETIAVVRTWVGFNAASVAPKTRGRGRG